MTIFNSTGKNVFHYLTFVTHKRVPVFKSERACELFIEVLEELRSELRFKLVGYVIMPDHVHLIVNPLGRNISRVGKGIKGRSARRIIDWLKDCDFVSSLAKLAFTRPQKRSHDFALWQKGIKSIDLESHKFIRQKLNYIHLNPVRAGLCDNPWEWKWSSYRNYLPHNPGDLPIEMDHRPYWTEKEFEEYDLNR